MGGIMNGKQTLYIDQWGGKHWAKTVKELRSKIGCGGSRVRKMFRDKKDGSYVHVGYVVGQHWLTAFRPVEIPG
jgi:hypothetical protein